jgi:hypothetical protein
MAQPGQDKFAKIALDKLFKKVFPGLTEWIERIQVTKAKPKAPKKKSAKTNA